MTFKIPTPRDPDYWSREKLVAEEKRVFEICNGCRLCFNLCPSFPALFKAVDALDVDSEEPLAHGEHDHDHGEHHLAATRADVRGQVEALERISMDVHQEVVDLCYQCKLCDPICPYTPPHEFAVDFPRLMLRHKAVDAKQHGVPLADRFLGNPDLVGKLGTMAPAIANFGATFEPNRVLMEKTLGVHRDRKLPEFAPETFLAWFRKRHPTRPRPEDVSGPKVVLFYTCSVQWNVPSVGRAAVEVLEHNGFTVYAPEMHCCGMPALDGGDVPRATEWAGKNVEVLLPYVRAGCDVVSPGPTCSYMMKKEWHDYLGSEAAEVVAKRSFDLMEYLFQLRRDGKLREDFRVEVGDIGYHVPCHLKVQKIGFRSRDVLKRLPGANVTLVDRCSCMDGTWGMKTEYYELSKKGAAPLLAELTASKPATLSSDCLIAKLQIEEGTGQEVLHPIEIMWKAYGGKDVVKRVSLDDVLPLEQFAAQRRTHLDEITRVKAKRRLAVGEHMTLLFENRATVRWQVHEMCRVENIRDLGGVRHELDTYNALLPGPHEISATLLIEYQDAAERSEWLGKLFGLHRHLRLEIAGEEPVPGTFEVGREEEEARRISAVQFVRFALGEKRAAALADSARAAEIVVDHPEYPARSPLAGAVRDALVADLTETA